jgi:hypothetical protein
MKKLRATLLRWAGFNVYSVHIEFPNKHVVLEYTTSCDAAAIMATAAWAAVNATGEYHGRPYGFFAGIERNGEVAVLKDAAGKLTDLDGNEYHSFFTAMKRFKKG